MDGHYRKRCGKGKAGSNRFLTNLVTKTPPKWVGAAVLRVKAIVIQNLLAGVSKKTVGAISFFNISLDRLLSPIRRPQCEQVVDDLL
jgi:hypothetical protein